MQSECKSATHSDGLGLVIGMGLGTIRLNYEPYQNVFLLYFYIVRHPLVLSIDLCL